MADLNAVWNYTRTYMVSGRTNPDPPTFISDLRSLGLTDQEKAWLIQQCQGFQSDIVIVSATIQDIQQV